MDKQISKIFKKYKKNCKKHDIIMHKISYIVYLYLFLNILIVTMKSFEFNYNKSK